LDPLATIRRRHASQRLSGEPLPSVTAVVRWMGAVQAQEFPEAKWSLAQRAAGAPTDTDVERAVADGEILRTHVLRPTWHFVAREDIRWLLRLTAPRINAASQSWYRQTGMEPKTIDRCLRTIERELADGEAKTRRELVAVLRDEVTEGDGFLFGHVFMQAELEQLVCSGPPRGTWQTYMLLDHRAPSDAGPSGDAALAELARRYFRSHGPATARDLAWWSGLKLTTAREAIALCDPQLEREEDDEGMPWFSLDGVPEAPARHRGLLLGTYDELVVAYKDLRVAAAGDAAPRTLLAPTIAIDAVTVGEWKARPANAPARIEATLHAPLDRDGQAEFEAAIGRFEAFLEREVSLDLKSAT
jgi:hypothetical protein